MNSSKQPMEPRISLITLGVNDLVQATIFYRDGLGLPLADHSNQNISFFSLSGCWLALYPKNCLAADAQIDVAGSGFCGITLAHNVRSKTEVDSLLSRAVQAGAQLNKAACNTFWGGYSGYFSDLDSYLWEIAWNPHFWIE